jgi:hypothetical protein
VARIILKTINRALVALELLKSLSAHRERLVCHPPSSSRIDHRVGFGLHPTSDIAPQAWQLPEKAGDVKSLPCTPDASGIPRVQFSVVLTVFAVGITTRNSAASVRPSEARKDDCQLQFLVQQRVDCKRSLSATAAERIWILGFSDPCRTCCDASTRLAANPSR